MSLFRMFRKEINPYAALGEAIADYVELGMNASLETMEYIYEIIGNDNNSNIFKLVCALDIFAVDFAAFVTFGDTEQKNAILNAFYKAIQDRKIVIDTHAIGVYADAVKVEHPRGPSFAVGLAFAELCGAEKDIRIVTIAGQLFHRTFHDSLEALKHIPIQ